MSALEEKTPTEKQFEEVDAVETVHADGTVDFVDIHAIGGNVQDMPRGYFWSPQFIGTVTVRTFQFRNCDAHSTFLTVY
jgi:hypothetical protein